MPEDKPEKPQEWTHSNDGVGYCVRMGGEPIGWADAVWSEQFAKRRNEDVEQAYAAGLAEGRKSASREIKIRVVVEANTPDAKVSVNT